MLKAARFLALPLTFRLVSTLHRGMPQKFLFRGVAGIGSGGFSAFWNRFKVTVCAPNRIGQRNDGGIELLGSRIAALRSSSIALAFEPMKKNVTPAYRCTWGSLGLAGRTLRKKLPASAYSFCSNNDLASAAWTVVLSGWESIPSGLAEALGPSFL